MTLDTTTFIQRYGDQLSVIASLALIILLVLWALWDAYRRDHPPIPHAKDRDFQEPLATAPEPETDEWYEQLGEHVERHPIHNPRPPQSADDRPEPPHL
jgi:ABC-type nickel/cobalt efflux system permease component RcnA